MSSRLEWTLPEQSMLHEHLTSPMLSPNHMTDGEVDSLHEQHPPIHRKRSSPVIHGNCMQQDETTIGHLQREDSDNDSANAPGEKKARYESHWDWIPSHHQPNRHQAPIMDYSFVNTDAIVSHSIIRTPPLHPLETSTSSSSSSSSPNLHPVHIHQKPPLSEKGTSRVRKLHALHQTGGGGGGQPGRKSNSTHELQSLMAGGTPLQAMRVKVACSNCKASKTKCDTARPCGRCSRTDRTATCCDPITTPVISSRQTHPNSSPMEEDEVIETNEQGYHPGLAHTTDPSNSATINPPQSSTTDNSSTFQQPYYSTGWNQTNLDMLQTFQTQWRAMHPEQQAKFHPNNIRLPPSAHRPATAAVAQPLGAITTPDITLSCAAHDPPLSSRAQSWLTSFLETFLHHLSAWHTKIAEAKAFDHTQGGQGEKNARMQQAGVLLRRSTFFADLIMGHVTSMMPGAEAALITEDYSSNNQPQKDIYSALNVGVLSMSLAPGTSLLAKPAWVNQSLAKILGYESPKHVEELFSNLEGVSIVYPKANLSVTIPAFMDAVFTGANNYAVQTEWRTKDNVAIQMLESVNIHYDNDTGGVHRTTSLLYVLPSSSNDQSRTPTVVTPLRGTPALAQQMNNNNNQTQHNQQQLRRAYESF